MKKKGMLLILVIIIVVLVGGVIYFNQSNKLSNNNDTTTGSNSDNKIENISKEEAEEILKDKYGIKDKETDYTISYGYMAKVKDENNKEYYAFRQTWLVGGHSSFLKNIFISLDGKEIKTSTLSKGYEDG